MKRNVIFSVLTLCVMIVCVFGLVACGANGVIIPNSNIDNSDVNSPSTDTPIIGGGDEIKIGLTVENAYAQASELGYMGTREEFVATVSSVESNADVDIENVNVDGDGYLFVTLTNGKTVNLGKLSCEHSYGEWIVGVAPTCTSIGYNVRICTKCNDKDYEFLEATGHKWDGGITVIEPLCYKDGVKMYSCTVCGSAKSEPIEAIGHNYENGKCTHCNETEPHGILKFNLSEDGTYYTVGKNSSYINSSAVTKLVIPGIYNGLPVIEIRNDAFRGLYTLAEVVIEEGVERIGNNCLGGCSKLESVELPNSLRSIGSEAFSFSGLKNIVIPRGVTEIVGNPFRTCDSLRSIVVEEGNEAYISVGNCLIETESKKLIAGTNLSEIPEDGSVECIGGSAFRKIEYLESIVIPESVKLIEDGAFDGCVRLREVYNYSELDIMVGSTQHGNVAYNALYVYGIDNDGSKLILTADGFVFCSDEEGYHLVTYKGEGENITLPSDFEGNGYDIVKYAFYELPVKSVVIPDSVTAIGYKAFYACGYLNSVRIGSGVKVIGDHAFSNTSLATVVIPASVTEIGNYAFAFNKKLSSVQIESGVKKIGGSTFSYCGSLSEIILPNSVESLGNSVFGSCTALERVVLSENITEIPAYAFQRCDALNDIVLPKGIRSIGHHAFMLCSLTSITIPYGVTQIDDYAFVGCRSLANVEIPNSVESIGKFAFASCRSLTEIIIPDSVTQIDEFAFISSGLVRITLGRGLKKISFRAFYSCYSLTKVTILGDLEEIGEYAFGSCHELKYIVIPATVRIIGESAFAGCVKLKNVILEDELNWTRVSGNEIETLSPDVLSDAGNVADLLRKIGRKWVKEERSDSGVSDGAENV